MQHSDGDERLLAAIRGHRVAADSPAEAGELRMAQRIGGIARSTMADVPTDAASLFDEQAPPLTDFDSIAAALGDELGSASPINTSIPGASEGVGRGEPSPAPLPISEVSRITGPVDATETGEVIRLHERRARARLWLPSVAAAAIALIAGSVFFLQSQGADQVASLELTPSLEGRASAELLESDDSYSLRVSVDGLAVEDGYLELWLIDAEIGQLISLGPVQDDGVYQLPAGLEPADFPVVDISVEPFDGDPTHSGQTVFRGQIDL